METIKSNILAASQRREISADTEAKLNGISIDEARKIIAALKRDEHIYQSSRSAKNFWGSTFAGYRSL